MQILPALHEHAHDHVVQFYEDDAYLCDVVAGHLAEAIGRGDGAVAIATAAHGSAIAAGLQSRGVDIEHAQIGGALTLLDAGAVLATIVNDGGSPDAARFNDVIGRILERAAAGGGGRISAFGELVDLLWKAGNPDGAIELEVLWNAISERYALRLLCGYSMDNFAAATHAEAFREICRQHGQVLPTERYTLEADTTRLLHISELQQREKALESELTYRRNLEARLLGALQERDELLEAERLARAEAEAANRAKSDFLAVISHELRTPLNAIAGYAELLEMEVPGPIGEPQREMLGRIQRSQKHLLGLIDEVLTFTRAEHTRQAAVEDVRMVEVLQGAELSLLPQMRARSLGYASTVAEGEIIARGDAGRVQQICTNLLANATKYTQPGGRIRVECDATADTVSVRVHDTGIGIAPQCLEMIFEPFFQVDTRLTRADEGLGLGLAIARRFARAMNGDLTVSSTAGQGSTFTLTLPRAMTAAA